METKQKSKMKKAIVEHIMLWTTIFVSFVVILFLTVDYSMVMRMKGNTDLMSQYAARMMAIGKSEDEIATGLNGMRVNYFTSVTGSDITCTTTENGTFKVIFNVVGLYTDTNILTSRDSFTSTSAVFNELSTDEIECSLTLTKQ